MTSAGRRAAQAAARIRREWATPGVRKSFPALGVRVAGGRVCLRLLPLWVLGDLDGAAAGVVWTADFSPQRGRRHPVIGTAFVAFGDDSTHRRRVRGDSIRPRLAAEVAEFNRLADAATGGAP